MYIISPKLELQAAVVSSPSPLTYPWSAVSVVSTKVHMTYEQHDKIIRANKDNVQ